ncbi:sushi, nidogen and EGF-like domain-containing protein 1 [Chanos chanos]|uniref:Sushi, nidogen and EGF-like domain-containing protein 1 n=1 Tax=Chanos chanos TaxID=29144 RepID=A0A6J2VFF1_CHACN|nr:sushi, nidogen and EGF-like domain-containing protein 1 [Chanos chanos]XP_030630864.1 sushi, nidogen and EGF-like domain-containing protein 1 [Chanos chanos]XP_030630865.1 sushi, nidogen and EGF-like domain-containing protein 1 [Chanos chanos]XP_030630866.1 sushi, nidogen and EGF-like domain-containing protein 1 [Chanos chanos]XP_030630868.1 sushi, nidogen and EGF-like domain-containing protein 1 [Chanos chanos]XP_030630869.1 sushi, nidogen and EGF-like domain-containing protein 1 [Chanos c
MGRWAFRVNHPAPAVLFPFGDGDLQTPVSDDGSSEEIILQQPFNYFGRTYNQIYVNNNGHLTFTEPFSEYSPYSGSGRDIIFPLWTDLNNGIQGTVSYRQATDSATLNQVTSQINQYFPDVSFAASWVFIATWNQVSYYSGAGAATFQVVLVSSGDVSFLLLNYGDIDATEQLWMVRKTQYCRL